MEESQHTNLPSKNLGSLLAENVLYHSVLKDLVLNNEKKLIT